MKWLDSITDSMDMSFEQTPGDSEGQRSLACCSRGVKNKRKNKEQEQNKENWATKHYIDSTTLGDRDPRVGAVLTVLSMAVGGVGKNGSFCLTEFLFVSEGGLY